MGTDSHQVTALTYKSIVYAAGQAWLCVEPYDSIYERLGEVGFKFTGDGAEAADMRWTQPIELTVRGEGNRALRCLVQPAFIGAVVEVPEDSREEVAE